jgi:hypothetical protein
MTATIDKSEAAASVFLDMVPPLKSRRLIRRLAVSLSTVSPSAFWNFHSYFHNIEDLFEIKRRTRFVFEEE